MCHTVRIAARTVVKVAGICLPLLAALPVFSGCGRSPAGLPPPPGVERILGTVQAEKLDVDLSSCPTTTAIENLLGDRFMESRRTKRFATVTTDNWYAKQQYACEVLRQRAQAGGLDSTSLDRCLAAVLPAPDGELAMVPVGAYLVANGPHGAWIIVCCWEYPPTRAPRGREMRHVRVWALAAADATVIAQMSCG